KAQLQNKASEISTLIRCFNIREGLKPEDDSLPKRFHQDILKTGHVITETELGVMLKEYYHHRDWDERGRPEKRPDIPYSEPISRNLL
ncbi:MAG: aldehyde ferredoxin oxidoreductase C-terminal domain-containing protein, partial [Desulfobacteraceae bacterium]|nr:aldehyde ferredoxin oxidoreductase C-terminal domain-containing protein [Desulfobacteraceae bacterium]